MSIPQDLIDQYLGELMGQSEPGAALHHLLVAASDMTALNPFGMPDPKALEVSFYALAPTGEVNVEDFIGKSIIMAINEAAAQMKMIHFAGLGIEGHTVLPDGNGVSEDLAKLLMAEQRVPEHPAAIEVTRLYAATRDGRRWSGMHYLTGPHAGQIDGPIVHTGRLHPSEEGRHPALIRMAVGQIR